MAIERLDLMTVREMRSLLVLAETRHFGRAAEALGIAQPTLSGLVRRAEKALRIRLFERTRRRFLITPRGEEALAAFRQIVAAAELAARLSETTRARPLSGEFRLGVIPTVGPFLMPSILLKLRRAYPELRLTLHESITADLVDGLQQGRLDAAILSPTPRLPPLELTALYREPFLLIAPRGHSVLALEKLTLSSLAAPEMVLLEEGHCLRDQVLEVCNRRAGSGAKLLTASLETLKYIVATGAGYSLMPNLAASADRNLEALIEFREFVGRIPGRIISLAARRGSSAATDVTAMADFIRAHLPGKVQAVTRAGGLAG